MTSNTGITMTSLDFKRTEEELNKYCKGRGQTDIATYRMNYPRGQFRENMQTKKVFLPEGPKRLIGKKLKHFAGAISRPVVCGQIVAPIPKSQKKKKKLWVTCHALTLPQCTVGWFETTQKPKIGKTQKIIKTCGGKKHVKVSQY